MGSIVVHDNYGTAFILKADMMSPAGFVADDRSLFLCKVKQFRPIYYKKKKIGIFTYSNYSKINKILTILFLLKDRKCEKKTNNFIFACQERFVAVPIVKASKIMCPVCSNSYSIGQSPCECIFLSDILLLKKFDIIGMNLYYIGTKTPVYKERENLLKEFFGGAVGNLLDEEDLSEEFDESPED